MVRKLAQSWKNTTKTIVNTDLDLQSIHSSFQRQVVNTNQNTKSSSPFLGTCCFHLPQSFHSQPNVQKSAETVLFFCCSLVELPQMQQPVTGWFHLFHFGSRLRFVCSSSLLELVKKFNNVTQLALLFLSGAVLGFHKQHKINKNEAEAILSAAWTVVSVRKPFFQNQLNENQIKKQQGCCRLPSESAMMDFIALEGFLADGNFVQKLGRTFFCQALEVDKGARGRKRSTTVCSV